MTRKGCKFTPMHKLKLSRALRGKRRSFLTKQKISETMMGKKISRKTKELHRKQALIRSRNAQKLLTHIVREHDVEAKSAKIDKRKNYTGCFLCSYSLVK